MFDYQRVNTVEIVAILCSCTSLHCGRTAYDRPDLSVYTTAKHEGSGLCVLHIFATRAMLALMIFDDLCRSVGEDVMRFTMFCYVLP